MTKQKDFLDFDGPNFDMDFGTVDMDNSVDIVVDNEAGKPSDKYKDEAKIFLEEIKVYNVDNIKKSTYRYIRGRNKMPIPAPGEQIRIRTQVQLNLITLILKIVERHGVIDELTISTYTLNREAMSILMQLKESGKIREINLLIAASYTYRDPKWKEEIKSMCVDNGMHLTFAWTHCKITLAKAEGNYYQFEGSMNYSTNNMTEQIIFENNEEIYNNDYEFINQVMKDKHNKALEVVC